MRFSHFAALLCAALLCSCKAIDKYHVPPVGIVSDTEQPRSLLYDGKIADNDAKLGAPTLANAYLKRYKETYDADYGGTPDPRNLDVKALETTRLGMTLIELRCELFFASIGRSAQKMDFLHREVEIISTVLTSTLGLVGASDDLVTATGLANGAALSSINNFSNVFFFSPEIGKVQRLVNDAFSALRTETLSPAKAPTDFDQAVRALKQYQMICTPHEIKRLVNDAVDAGKVKIFYRDSSATGLDPHVDLLFSRIAMVLSEIEDSDSESTSKIAGVSSNQVVLLKWLFSDPAPSPQEIDFICIALQSEDLRRKLCKGQIGSRGINQKLTSENKSDIKELVRAVELSTNDWVKTDLGHIRDVYNVDKDRLAVLMTAAKTAPNSTKDAAAAAVADAALVITARATKDETAPSAPTDVTVGIEKPR
ncbi:hypothetical protein [Sphingomonas sp. dw_22]|uniref:hypothetical protein n=1 Tax=Sphingomonas sp. dw_22 TaxID=2721175 RepID=UPI001BD27298|nr:hypothetical protein [Sphingomonas sp. dw_22]